MKSTDGLYLILLAIIIFFNGCKESDPTEPVDYEFIASPDSLFFTEGSLTKTLYLLLDPPGSTGWFITTSPNWLSFDKTSGSIDNKTTSLQITANYDSLNPGLASGVIEILAEQGGKVKIAVYFSVSEHPKISLNSNSFSFPSGVSQQELKITNSGTGILNWQLLASGDTVSFYPKIGSLLAGKSVPVLITVNKNKLMPGTHQISLQLNSNGENMPAQQISLITEVPSNPLLYVSKDSLLFNYFIDTIKFHIVNRGNSDMTWNLNENAGYLLVDKTGGQLAMNDSTEVIATINRSGMQTGILESEINITAANNQSKNLKVKVKTFKEEKQFFSFSVLDAEYDNVNNKIVTISAGPDRLQIISPETGSIQQVDLPLAPNCISVHPSGGYAAVGTNGKVLYVNLNSAAIENNYNISCDAWDIVLAGNGWIYVFPKQDQWTRIRCINRGTGTESIHTGSLIYDHTSAKLHPSGKYIFGANNGLSPSDIEKYDIQGGTAVYLKDSPYHGEYSFGGDLWIMQNGTRLFVKSANAFKLTEGSDDMTYNGKLSGTLGIKWLTNSDVTGKLYAIPLVETISWYTKPGDFVKEYESTYLNYQRDLPLQGYLVPDGSGGGNLYKAEGYYVFTENTGTKLYVLTKAENAAGIVNDWALIRIVL